MRRKRGKEEWIVRQRNEGKIGQVGGKEGGKVNENKVLWRWEEGSGS